MRKFCYFFIILITMFAFSVGVPAFADNNYVYIAGTPIGINVNTEGVIIDGKSEVITDNGRVSPAESLDIRAGDVLLKIDDNKISNINDIKLALNSSDDIVDLTIKRGETILNFELNIAIESLNKEKRLGLLIRENVSGIGTLTFVTPNNRFAALGHAIFDNGIAFNELQNGRIYKASILSVQRGLKGAPGELRGVFVAGENLLGIVEANSNFGLYGNYVGSIKGFKKIEIGSKSDVKIGKAQILSTVAGDIPKYYDVEIVKASYQGNEAEKGLIVRVTDNSLIEQTGGIVQGMSGSPIVQEGKIIGALTHVFINDPLKGYGLYIDFMLNK